jgi:hypothetical protein
MSKNQLQLCQLIIAAPGIHEMIQFGVRRRQLGVGIEFSSLIEFAQHDDDGVYNK